MQPHTPAQEAFLADLLLVNTDARAISVIEAAFTARNAMTVFSDDLALLEACDKVAG